MNNIREIRITKYNPENRHEEGHYLVDEWTIISDLGREKYPDFTIEEYLETENKYWLVFESILKSLGICRGVFPGNGSKLDPYQRRRYEKTRKRYVKEDREEYSDKIWFPYVDEAQKAYDELDPLPGDWLDLDQIKIVFTASIREGRIGGCSFDFSRDTSAFVSDDCYFYFRSEREFSWEDQEGIYVEEHVWYDPPLEDYYEYDEDAIDDIEYDDDDDDI